jgi:hypothetical protein
VPGVLAVGADHGDLTPAVDLADETASGDVAVDPPLGFGVVALLFQARRTPGPSRSGSGCSAQGAGRGCGRARVLVFLKIDFSSTLQLKPGLCYDAGERTAAVARPTPRQPCPLPPWHIKSERLARGHPCAS